MKRKQFTATIQDEAGSPLATGIAFAMNSTIRMTEQLVRKHARALGEIFEGQPPVRVGDVYTRRWVGTGGSVVTTMAAINTEEE